MGIIAKRRKLVQSDTFVGYIDSDGTLSIEHYNANKDPYRIAPGEEIPVPLPHNSSIVSAMGQYIFDSTEERYLQVLKDYNIEVSTLSKSSIEGRGSRARDTLIIRTTNDADITSWKTAANEIYDLINDVAKPAGLLFRLEIRNPSKMYTGPSSIVKLDSEAYHALVAAQPIVEDQVDAFIPRMMHRVISSRMIGYESSDERRRPTVMILVAAGSRLDWNTVEAKIVAETKTEDDGKDVEVFIEIGPSYLYPS